MNFSYINFNKIGSNDTRDINLGYNCPCRIGYLDIGY